MAGLVIIKSNAQLDADAAAQEARDAQLRQSAPVLSGLAGYVRKCWEAARDAKQPIENTMLKALRQRRGEYEADKLAAIRESGGSELFMMLTETKCRGAESWLRDILLDEGIVPFALKPTPRPEMPADFQQSVTQSIGQKVIQIVQSGMQLDPMVMEQMKEQAEEEIRQKLLAEAVDRAEAMKRTIDDQFAEGGMIDAFNAFISDLATYPAAVVKGPEVRRARQLEWEQDEAGAYVPKVQDKLIPTYRRVDPFRFYPEPGVTRLSDGYCLEHHRLSDADLSDLIGVPGYDDGAIRAVLATGANNEWLWSAEHTKAELENKYNIWRSESNKYDALEFWGRVSGKDLIDFGLDADEVPDTARMYDACVWLIGSYVIKATLNYDPLGCKPYRITSATKRPGALWGVSYPELIEDVQSMCNAAARALANNMGLACLPADTVVYRNGTGNDPSRREVTIGELWEQKHKPNSGLRRNLLRVLDERTGEFVSNRVRDVHFNGVRPVFRVTTETGYVIKATDNHRFMSADGAWRQLESFAPGDFIAVNGAETPLAHRRSQIRASHASVDTTALPATAVMAPEQALVDHEAHYSRMVVAEGAMSVAGMCKDCGTPLSAKAGALRCRSCAAKKENSAWNSKQAQDALNSQEGTATTARARALQRGQLKHACEVCGATKTLHIHHMDKSPWNGAVENLKTLCEPCHKQWHARNDHKGKNPFLHKYLDYDRIVAIEVLPAEPVYDLEMESPHHNFVANGFVSHNSGPQVEVSIDRLAEGEKITQIFPWKIWQTVADPLGSGQPAVRFNQPDDRSGPLMNVYQNFARLADEQSGIPAYVYGDGQVGGAGRTASGLSMLMGSAGKGIRQTIMHIDFDVIGPIVSDQYNWNMQYVDDPSIKGDCEIIPRGAVTLANREQLNVRRVEFLQATANPIDSQIVGLKGRAALLREVAKGLAMPVDDLVPSDEQIDVQEAVRKQQEMQMAQMQAAPKQVNINGPEQGTPPGQTPKVGAPAMSPGGTPAGGKGANTVSNQITGKGGQ